MHITEVEYLRDGPVRNTHYVCRLRMDGLLLRVYECNALKIVVANLSNYDRFRVYETYPDDSQVDGGNEVIGCEGGADVEPLYFEVKSTHARFVLSAFVAHYAKLQGYPEEFIKQAERDCKAEEEEAK